MTSDLNHLLDHWFGESRENPEAIPGQMQFWFQATAEQDTELREKFSDLYARAAAGELRDWQTSPRGRLGLILLLDQLPRCLYRGTPDAFKHDPFSASLCLAGIDQKIDLQISEIERVFFYLPLQHIEDIAGQEAGVGAYKRLEAEQTTLREMYGGFRQYAELHRDIIARFGRFPHRNEVLGRGNTAEEQVYLDDDAPTFGQ